MAAVFSLGILGWAIAAPVTAQETKTDKKAEKAEAKPAKKVTAKAEAKPAAKSTAKTEEKADDKAAKKEEKPAAPIKLPATVYSTGYKGSYEELIGFINTQIREGWVANEVMPSDVADDGEWIRRVHLDIVGHIPDLETTEKFLEDKAKDKRFQMIESLLEDPGYVRNFTTIWANLLIGRIPQRDISRPAMEKFLRESFAKNRAWSDIVTDLLTAEGHHIENGAANYLLSHLNDGQVPATAISAKLFLGRQVQCTQCHNHPFNEWKQDAFWEFNSFFKQAEKVEHRKYDERTGRMVFDYMELIVKNDVEEGVFFETRNALMKVAYPRYHGVDVDREPSTNRRKELAKLILQGDHTEVAEAMVNRMWSQFFGYGFVKPVDDMGPHNLPSHPAALERLTKEFVKSGYDMKQLVRWICNSEAYNLTSKFNERNQKDNPPAGEPQLFSHLYVKSMNVEQLYDSLLIATNADKAGTGSDDKVNANRQQWLRRFVQAFGTDENDESTSFDGTIPQALMMMNGELVQKALKGETGSRLHKVVNGKGSPALKIRQLYLVSLCRNPTRGEISKAEAVLKGAKSPMEAYQDLYWALLNSNEFIFNF